MQCLWMQDNIVVEAMCRWFQVICKYNRYFALSLSKFVNFYTFLHICDWVLVSEKIYLLYHRKYYIEWKSVSGNMWKCWIYVRVTYVESMVGVAKC